VIGGGHRVVALAGNIQDATVLVDGFLSDLGTIRIGASKYWRFKNRTGPKNHQLNFHRLGLSFMEGKMGRGILLWLLGIPIPIIIFACSAVSCRCDFVWHRGR
jgi:hypothetical protein